MSLTGNRTAQYADSGGGCMWRFRYADFSSYPWRRCGSESVCTGVRKRVCVCVCDTEIFIHVRYFLGGVRIDFVLLSRSIFFIFTNFRSFSLSLLLSLSSNAIDFSVFPIPHLIKSVFFPFVCLFVLIHSRCSSVLSQ